MEEERVCAAKRGEAVWVGWVGRGMEGGRERERSAKLKWMTGGIDR